jgi:Orn/Lys/Arg decarboxylase, major domain
VTASEAPVADPAPLVAALRSDAEDRLVPFSRPGHKRGQGAAGELRALLGDGVFDRDVWRNTGDHDRLRRAAEALAARTWGADRSFFLVNGSSSGNHAYLLAAVGPGDEVVAGRDLHTSLLVGLILTGPGRCTWPRGPIPSSGSAWGRTRGTWPPPSTATPRPGWSPWSAPPTTG